ncbi:hypothetical protein GCM10010405_02630 [Streptomyces macrosporus]|uniref:Uncharacterized protein n=1 Tax=Streptomyces macrosporus TaxID=44032 RepID=A0ABN3J8H1_9ACTN
MAEVPLATAAGRARAKAERRTVPALAARRRLSVNATMLLFTVVGGMRFRMSEVLQRPELREQALSCQCCEHSFSVR